MRSRKTLLRTLVPAALTLLAAALAVPSAGAQATDPAAAAALFKQGKEAAKSGDYATACPRFAESLRLDPAPGTLLNLADCEEHQGKLASAWQHFQRATEVLPAGDPRVAVARTKAADLEKRVPKLVIRLAAGAPAGTRVTRDGVEVGVGALGTPIPVEVGEHVVAAIAPGRAERRVTVLSVEGKTVETAVSPGDPVAPPAASSAPTVVPPPPTSATPLPPPAPAPTSSAMSPVVGWSVLGVGVAGLIVGGITGAMLASKRSVVDEHCDANKRCDETGLSAADSGRSLRVPNVVAWVVGFGGVGIGTYLVLTRRTDGAPASTVGAVTVPGGAVLRGGGTF